MLICLKCETRVEDDHYEPCPDCGAREWAWVLDHPYELTFNDYALFLKRIGVSKE